MKKILVIEDEQAIADAVLHSLAREGFSATWCARGEAGMAELEKATFDLIVLDVGLPDVSGFELCKRIRAASTVPIIFLSARSEEIDRIVGLEIGGDDYMAKPFSPRELGARVKAVLKRAGRPAPSKAATLVIDGEKMTANFRGRKLELTRYEFKLLALLAKHPGRVYTRDMLLENVWDDATSSVDRTVDTHIKSLRGKFRAVDESADPILTHRGTGYSLREDL